MRLLADLGVTDVGENRHQEAEAKAAECADLGLRWHFIGGLQSNKAAAVAAYADVVESARPRQAGRPAVPRRARPAATTSTCSSRSASTRPVPTTGRVRPRTTSPTSPRRVEEAGMLRLRGLMAVAPLGEDPRAAFARLAAIHADLLAEHPAATWSCRPA